jgi:hypothetical protein
MLIGSASAEVLTGEPGEIGVAGIALVLIGVVALAGCIVSWWWDQLAGILLILVAIGLAVHIGVYAGRNHFLAWPMLGFPYSSPADYSSAPGGAPERHHSKK